MKKLIEGITRYTQEVHPQNQALFDQLKSGQEPTVLFVTCADSRVDPSLITQTQPGEIFVCRNAGNIIPPISAGLPAEATVASIEYAVKVLPITNIVICGHSDCGAVKGAMNVVTTEDLPEVGAWLQYADIGDGETLDEAIEANVVAQMENLRSYEFITDGIEVSGCVYDIGSGQVRAYNGTSFEAIT